MITLTPNNASGVTGIALVNSRMEAAKSPELPTHPGTKKQKQTMKVASMNPLH